MMHQSYLAYGSNMGLTRVYCGRCAEETIHRRDECIHCGAGRRPPEPVKPKRGFNNSVKPARRPYCVEFGGEHLSLKDIAKRSGLAYATVTQRFRNGLRGEALTAKVPPMMARPKRNAA